MYYSVIVVIAVLGLLGTWHSRQQRDAKINKQGTTQPAVGATWNEAVAVYACDRFLPNIKTNKDPFGLTTLGDGIIRIHPTQKAAAGKNATLGKFADSIGMKLNAGELQVPGGKLYVDGDKCGGKASHVYVKQYGFLGDTAGVILKQDPSTVLLADQQMLTIAFVPASDKGKIPPPPAGVQNNLKALQPSSSTTTLPPATVPPVASTVPKATTTVPKHTTTTKK
jgi:hypothetical protein